MTFLFILTFLVIFLPLVYINADCKKNKIILTGICTIRY